MNTYLGFLRRRFLWAFAGLVVFLSYSWLWGGWFVRTMLGVTGLGRVDPSGGPETAGHWMGLVIGTLVVMAPAILGFLAYLVAWIGWPGRPAPPRRNRCAGMGMGLAVAVTAFMLVGLAGYYWPVGRWRGGLHRYADAVDAEALGSAWVGDMYFGLLLALIGLYLVIFGAAIFLPSHLGLVGWSEEQKPEQKPEQRPGRAGGEADPAVGPGGTASPAPPETTGIWWPYAAGAAVVLVSLVVTVWPHLSPAA